MNPPKNWHILSQFSYRQITNSIACLLQSISIGLIHQIQSNQSTPDTHANSTTQNHHDSYEKFHQRRLHKHTTTRKVTIQKPLFSHLTGSLTRTHISLNFPFPNSSATHRTARVTAPEESRPEAAQNVSIRTTRGYIRIIPLGGCWIFKRKTAEMEHNGPGPSRRLRNERRKSICV